uniref:Uncharacterized protein n=1 Tax=Branchiostoma floridae TaxID=7739 RepID=C3Z5M4_BRAFL|eukprot:XP_002596125.1 hypothetical protein BRAFLDRAFT_66149 [Branchiostoma floridae]
MGGKSTILHYGIQKSIPVSQPPITNHKNTTTTELTDGKSAILHRDNEIKKSTSQPPISSDTDHNSITVTKGDSVNIVIDKSDGVLTGTVADVMVKKEGELNRTTDVMEKGTSDGPVIGTVDIIITVLCCLIGTCLILMLIKCRQLQDPCNPNNRLPAAAAAIPSQNTVQFQNPVYVATCTTNESDPPMRGDVPTQAIQTSPNLCNQTIQNGPTDHDQLSQDSDNHNSAVTNKCLKSPSAKSETNVKESQNLATRTLPELPENTDSSVESTSPIYVNEAEKDAAVDHVYEYVP